MANSTNSNLITPNTCDIRTDKVKSSKMLFYLQLICVVLMFLGGCYKLYEKRYVGKPDVKVQSSTLYTPDYK